MKKNNLNYANSMLFRMIMKQYADAVQVKVLFTRAENYVDNEEE